MENPFQIHPLLSHKWALMFDVRIGGKSYNMQSGCGGKKSDKDTKFAEISSCIKKMCKL